VTAGSDGGLTTRDTEVSIRRSEGFREAIMADDTDFHLWRPHPWHGLSPGPNPPLELRAFIEITPFDLVKYEVDKSTGYTIIDRPQRTSSQPPALYGFVPQTYCAERVCDLMPGAKVGDGDPLDICVISERRIDRGGIVIDARVIGGLQMLDDGEADDKIIAVLHNDYVWKDVENISDLPDVLVQRLTHYFNTYKMSDGLDTSVRILDTYGPYHAKAVIEASMADYEEHYGDVRRRSERAVEKMISG
jgi:inorganic pyrophosphatase